jgi:glycosyltransferase involved in cell wall biosynthesis
VNLPYALLIGLAEPLRRVLKVPICCTLQGEDLFLDGLGEPYRSESLNLIREAAVHVDAFLAVSQYYADYMPKYLRIPASKVRVAPLGINLEGYTPQRSERPGEPFTIGFFARVAPEKGLHVLCDAYRRMRARSTAANARLVAAGYLAPEHRAYLDGISQQMEVAGLAREFEYRGEVDRAGKIAFLQNLDVMSVPATYDEPKGMFLFEAMALGVPVVQPRRGAFPEIIEKTGGGVLVDPGDLDALARAFQELQDDPARRAALGAAGATGVRAHYTVGQMAETVEQVYSEVIRRQVVVV